MDCYILSNCYTNFTVCYYDLAQAQQRIQEKQFVSKFWLAGAPLPDGAKSTSASPHPAPIVLWDYG